jgi:hypothetical protein
MCVLCLCYQEYATYAFPHTDFSLHAARNTSTVNIFNPRKIRTTVKLLWNESSPLKISAKSSDLLKEPNENSTSTFNRKEELNSYISSNSNLFRPVRLSSQMVHSEINSYREIQADSFLNSKSFCNSSFCKLTT